MLCLRNIAVCFFKNCSYHIYLFFLQVYLGAETFIQIKHFVHRIHFQPHTETFTGRVKFEAQKYVLRQDMASIPIFIERTNNFFVEKYCLPCFGVLRFFPCDIVYQSHSGSTAS